MTNDLDTPALAAGVVLLLFTPMLDRRVSMILTVALLGALIAIDVLEIASHSQGMSGRRAA